MPSKRKRQTDNKGMEISDKNLEEKEESNKLKLEIYRVKDANQAAYSQVIYYFMLHTLNRYNIY